MVTWLLESGVDTVFLSTAGKFRGRLVSGEGKNVELRRAQFAHLDDEPFLLDLAQRFVRGKVQNSRSVMRRQQRDLQDPDLESALIRMRHVVSRLDSTQTLDELRGWEGTAAAMWFACFPKMVKVDGFPFGGRTRRPPKDALNALLSFGYTMLEGTVTTAAQTVGLDIFVGHLHSVANGKPSLVLDLMEEFRPVLVDATVLRAVNRRQITPADFVYQHELELPEGVGSGEGQEVKREDYPVLMRHEGMRKFILLYEAALRQRITYPRSGTNLTWRAVCLEQARLLARHIKGEEPYESFVVR